MAVLLIKCPHTDRPISTGIEIDGAETLAKLPDVLSHVNARSVVLSTPGGRGRLGCKTYWKFHRLRTMRRRGARRAYARSITKECRAMLGR